MQDVIARDLRGAVPRDQRERIQRDRRVADIGDVVLDREQIAVVDRNGAVEGEAVAIVIFQRDRACYGVRLPEPSCCHTVFWSGSLRSSRWPRPSRIRRNRGSRCPRAKTARSRGEAGSTVSRNCTSDRSSMRAPFSEMLPISARGVDLDARARRQWRCRGRRPVRWKPAGSRRRIGRRRRRRAGLRGRRRCGLRRRLHQSRSASARRALLFHLRQVEEILPADQHEAGQNDGEDGVAIVGHRSRSRHSVRLAACVARFRPRSGCRSRRWSAERRSSSMVAKSRFRAARRPTST